MRLMEVRSSGVTHSAAPSNFSTGSDAQSRPVTQRRFTETIFLPSVPSPRENPRMPQVLQKVWWMCFLPNW